MPDAVLPAYVRLSGILLSALCILLDNAYLYLTASLIAFQFDYYRLLGNPGIIKGITMVILIHADE